MLLKGLEAQGSSYYYLEKLKGQTSKISYFNFGESLKAIETFTLQDVYIFTKEGFLKGY